MQRCARVLVLVVACEVAASLAAAQSTPPGKPPLLFADGELPTRQREQLARQAEAVSRWAMVQRVVAAVRAQNAAPLTSERIAELDAAWQRGENPDGLATRLAANDCAIALQSAITANPGFAEAFVTDELGALVCMTTRTSDYAQADEETWQRAYAGGAGALFVDAARHDESVGSTVYPIAVPVRWAGRAIGVLVVSRLVAGEG
jgi:hypothetical protein